MCLFARILVTMANVPWPLFAEVDLPVAALEWFQNRGNQQILLEWNQIPLVDRERIDEMVDEVMGRHPGEIHPANWPLVIQVWIERWNFLQFWAPAGGADTPPPTPPTTPEIVESVPTTPSS